MEKNKFKTQNLYVSEEEKILNWQEVQTAFKKTFGVEVYDSWLQKITLIKEYNDFLILGVPTRFFRDWIVSRYLDKILEQVRNFKLSINRVEFKIIEENKNENTFHEVGPCHEPMDPLIAKAKKEGMLSIPLLSLNKYRKLVHYQSKKKNL